MTPDCCALSGLGRVRWLLTGSSDVFMDIVLRPALFLLCLCLAHTCAAEASPSRETTLDDRAPDAGAPDTSVVPTELPNHAVTYRDSASAPLRAPRLDTAPTMDRTLSEPVVLVLLGTALLVAAFAARRLQGRGFRIRLESTVMGREWVAAREAEDAAMTRWTDAYQHSKPAVRTVRKLQPAKRPEMSFPPASPSDTAHQSAVRH